MSIAELQTNTEHFLRTNYVKIVGGAAAALAGPSYFKMGPDPAGGGICITKLNDRREGPDVFEAWYIPMEQIGSFAANRLPTIEESPLRIMLTCQLTACLFVVGSDGESTTVAHIQPDKKAHTNLSQDQANAARQSDMRMAARVRGMKTFMSHSQPFDNFTKGYDYYSGKEERVAIVGVRDAEGHWNILAQVVNKDKTVKDVHRI